MKTQTEALKRYLDDCDKHAIVPDIAGAFHFAWQEALAQPEQEPHEQEQSDCSMCDEGCCTGRTGCAALHPEPSKPPQRKPLTDEQTIILKNTTCPEIDWKARYFVEMNNGERNKWMLEWFMAFKVAIEAAHGIKGEA